MSKAAPNRTVEDIIAPLREDYRRTITPYVTVGPLSDHALDRLDDEAAKRGITRGRLVHNMLSAIVEDDLFAAVLDDT